MVMLDHQFICVNVANTFRRWRIRKVHWNWTNPFQLLLAGPNGPETFDHLTRLKWLKTLHKILFVSLELANDARQPPQINSPTSWLTVLFLSIFQTGHEKSWLLKHRISLGPLIDLRELFHTASAYLPQQLFIPRHPALAGHNLRAPPRHRSTWSPSTHKTSRYCSWKTSIRAAVIYWPHRAIRLRPWRPHCRRIN